ncbi:hypothetical protein JRQ81_017755 [Phrynocephalus forsythii]|uniref:Uncharacterized protein n=1 Tax=Phrynocephalus forsythii TaxID=171643 RepID=A0A9Q0XQY5_9SAUR|nr:hypothetical protein JRQ81_017755 [Phrynocephalus forsythii]
MRRGGGGATKPAKQEEESEESATGPLRATIGQTAEQQQLPPFQGKWTGGSLTCRWAAGREAEAKAKCPGWQGEITPRSTGALELRSFRENRRLPRQQPERAEKPLSHTSRDERPVLTKLAYASWISLVRYGESPED